MLRVFIGYDEVESVAYHVLAHSIMRHASEPVGVYPIALNNLKKWYWRKRDPKQSNDFSFSRFLVPFLSGFNGLSLFMDCDMLVRGDITGIVPPSEDFLLRDSIACVKHDYTPKDDIKYLGNRQHKYEKKNWSSVMLFNNKNCGALSPEYVNEASGLQLHQFKWTTENKIYPLGLEWNWLVGEYDHLNDAKIVHYTVGGPWFDEYSDCDYAEEWFHEFELMNHTRQQNSSPVIRIK